MVLNHLVTIRREAQPSDIPDSVLLLQEKLLEKYGDAVIAVLFYGSCLHDVSTSEGIIDLYVVVDNYGAINAGRIATMVDWFVPPTVRFLQLTNNGEEVRAKYALISRSDFISGTSTRWFHGYFSARLAQPVAVIYTRDSDSEMLTYKALANAVITLASRTMPMLPSSFQADQLWIQALTLSYATELRSERLGYSEKIINRDRGYYQQVLGAAVADNLLPAEQMKTDTQVYHAEISSIRRQWCRFNWMVRRIQGKTVSILRLLKGMYTFEGGLDYLAWKLERHSGQKITIPDKVRRRPLLHIWGLFWQLHRQGVFR